MTNAIIFKLQTQPLQHFKEFKIKTFMLELYKPTNVKQIL